MPEERSRGRAERGRCPLRAIGFRSAGTGSARAAADARPVPRGSVVAATTGLLGLSSTRRAAVLALVVCALALTVVVPLRNYVAQRQELAAVTAQQQALAAEVDELNRERARLSDPAEIAAEARSRLGYVRPGEVLYIVQSPVHGRRPRRRPGDRRPALVPPAVAGGRRRPGGGRARG